MDETQTGAIRDAKGRFITRPPNSAPPITSDTARSMVQRRIDKFRQAGAKGAKKAALAIDPTIETVYDAHALLVERAFVEFMDKPRSDMLDELSKAYGARALPHEREQAQAQAGATLTLSPDIARALVDQLVQARASVVDGHVVGDGQAETDAEADK